jgi:anti-sigma B factor antagonist
VSGALINPARAADGAVVVDVRGELDIESADRLRRILSDTARLHPPRIVVDLLHVTFIDSTGLSALMAGRSAAQTVGVAYSVRHPSGFVATQLRQTGLYEALLTRG